MALQDTDNLIVQRGTTLNKVQIQNMSTIQDTDLLVIGRGSESYKITGQDFMDQVNPPDPDYAPSMTGATLSGTGAGFSGETYTTTLQNYDGGNPEATLGMKARVNGTFNLVGETSSITNVNGNVLTLTDRKDLDNGLFKPGDVVQENIDPGATEEWAGFVELTQAVNSYDTGTPYLYDGGVYSSTSTNLLAFDRNELGDTYSLTFTFVGGAEKFQTYTSTSADGAWTQVVGNTQGPFTIDQDTTSYNRFVQIYGTGSGEFLYKIDGTANGKTVETVVSINQSSPEMTLSGGTWNVGDTVKNTVARAPEITPITDEIVGFISGKINYSSRVSIVGPDAFHPVDNGPDKIFDGDPNTFCAVESSSASEQVEIVFDAVGLNLDTSNGNVVARSAGGWTFKVTGSLGTADKAISSDPVGSSLPAVGILQEIRVKGNGANWMYLKEGGNFLVDDSDNNVLTLASDKDLDNFNAGDDVEQDSGYTPQTSAITNVTATSVSKVKGYYSSDIPSNLTEAISGTEFDMSKGGVNVVENSHYLTLVCDPGCPDSGSVFKTDYGAIFDMKFTNGVGNFDKDGIKLDASDQPPSGPSNTLDIVFSNGGTSGYIVNTQAAYTVIKTTANSTLPAISDAALGSSTTLTLTDDTDLANFRVGDTVPVPDGAAQTADVKFVLTEPYQDRSDYLLRSGFVDNPGSQDAPLGAYTDIIKVTGPGVLRLNAVAYLDIGPVTVELVNATTPDPLEYDGTSATRVCPDFVTFGAGGGEMRIHWNKDVASAHVLYYLWYSGQNESLWDGNIISNGATYETAGMINASITAIGPGNTLTFDGGTFNVGDTVTGPATTPATGTVASASGTTMTLSTSDESGTKRWIVNAGKTVVGPTGPATKVTSYLTWDNNNNVTGMQTNDPGYAPVTDLDLTFTDPAPTGQTWDQELPAGTTIETRVEATNSEGTADSGWSNTVTPRFQPVDADPQEAFTATALKLLTFLNRKHVYCAAQAEASRDQLIQQLAAAGYDLTEILKYL